MGQYIKNYSGNVTHVKSVYFTSIWHIQSNVQVTVKKTVNQLYIYSTLLGAAIRCKQYSEIAVESGTHVKSAPFSLSDEIMHFRSRCYSKLTAVGHDNDNEVS